MIYLPDDKMFPNQFVDVKLPTKREIFGRTGGLPVTPNGVYTKEDSAQIGRSSRESAEAFVSAAESYESPQNNESQPVN